MPLFLLPLLGWGKSALSFFIRPPGSWIACALAGVFGVWLYGHHKFNEGVLKCEAAHAEAAANEAARQVKAVNAVNDASNLRTDDAKKANADNKAKVIYIHDKAAALPNASDECIPADIADGLRALH